MIPATYEEARRVLREFIPRAGRLYAEERNFDRGPQNRKNVSLLSAALQRRILSEKEVLQAVSQVHSFDASEKFTQEIFWRSYWKSWLELRPSVWRDYQKSLKFSKTQDFPDLEKALFAKTGIECFDFWRKELQETGYLHNHARMWFASIWIFTLKLPWQLGAQLFEEELCDFDPASNTLSWRWVAGFHTSGKHYIARAENIQKFTEGRFNPEGQLVENPQSPSYLAPLQEPLRENFVPFRSSSLKTGLLIHSEDLSLESLDWGAFIPSGLGVFDSVKKRSSRVEKYHQTALQDALTRHEKYFALKPELISGTNFVEGVTAWSQKNSFQEIVLIKPWQGYLKEHWDKVDKALESRSVKCRYLRRHYDKELAGKAKSGFFSFKAELPLVWERVQSEPQKETLWEVVS